MSDATATLERVDNPKTEDEWRPYVGELVQLKTRHGKNGVSQYPGARLLRVESGAAQVQPPRHKKSEWVRLENVRLWRKGMHQEEERMAKREEKRSGTWAPPASEAAPTWVAIYCPSLNKFFGAGGFKYSGKDAAAYPNEHKAMVARSNYKCRYFKGQKFPDSDYCSAAQAIAHETKQALAKAAASEAAGTLARTIVDRALKRQPDGPAPEPAPAAEPTQQTLALPPPAAPPAPEPAAAALAPMSCADCFAEYVRLATEEAAAEAMMLEARGKRIQAYTRFQLDQERRKLGL